MIESFLSGLGLGAGLILAIGPQNAFVLRQGLLDEHVLPVVLVCVLADAVLIAAGVAGLGAVMTGMGALSAGLVWIGVGFLAYYGARSLHAAWTGGETLEAAKTGAGSLWTAVATCLSLTFLNPHVYLDTVLVVGTVANRYAEPWLFGAGAVLASAIFFPVLGYGAAALRPLFARPATWRVLDALIGIVMWAIAVSLAYDVLAG